MLWPCFIHVLVTFQTCVGHASHMFWSCFRHVLVMFQSEDSQSVSLSDSQSVSLRVCRAVSLLIYQFVRLSVCQFVRLSVSQVVSLSGRRSYIHSYSTRKFQNRYVFSIVLIAFWSATGVCEKTNAMSRSGWQPPAPRSSMLARIGFWSAKRCKKTQLL